jgi:hypothetical protein
MIQHPLLLAALSFSMQLQAVAPQPDASIYGKTSESDPTAVVPQVGFVVVDLTGPGGFSAQATADSTGSYTIAGLSEGTYSLRFERSGFIPLTLDVRVPAHGSVHLDVSLDRTPPMMQTIKVVARDGLPRISESPNSISAYRPWHTDGEKMRADPSLDFPDVIRTLTTSTYAQIGPESGGGLHLQGGATDHTLLQIDGVPLYNAIHAGDHSSALDPDAVATMKVYGEPRASDGGRLAGVVDISTRSALPDSQHFRTAIWPTGMRVLTAIPFSAGSALIGARSNYARPLQGNTREPLSLDPVDFFGAASVPLGGGSLTGLVFTSADAIAFDAGPSLPQASTPKDNRLDWSSSANGISWRRDTDTHAVDMRVWRSGTMVGANWLSTSADAFRLANKFVQTAAAGSVSWFGHQTHTTLGASVENLGTSYVVSSPTSSDAALSSSLLSMNSQYLITSAFVEHSRQLADRLFATVGERLVSRADKELLFEPRLALAYTTPNGVVFSAAFARTHQYMQSLYNEESVVDAMASLEVPVLAGSHGIPTALSSSVSAEVEVPIGSKTVFTAAGFVRAFEGLALAAPVDGGPFPTHAIAFGSGGAYGGIFRLREHTGSLAVEGAYSISGVSREWSERSYRPSFAPSQNFLLSAGYQLGQNTMFRASGSMSAVRSTSPIVGAVGWEWQDMLSTQREISGSPEYSAATFDRGRLAPYMRIDIGAQQNLNFSAPIRMKASLFANVDNLLGRRNTLGLVQDAYGTRRLGMLPRSLSLGVTLGF